jgi:hypothetical protein
MNRIPSRWSISCWRSPAFHTDIPAATILPFGDYGVGAANLADVVGQAQAALVRHLFVLTTLDDLRVDENVMPGLGGWYGDCCRVAARPAGAIILLVRRGQLNDNYALKDAHLRGGQAYAVGAAQGFQHIIDQGLGGGVYLFQLL